ncbi:MAG: YqaE/Pmp3 family membrane protein [Victivallales bacterium]|nr:YqaE/Pmp3 family membrane protein [Victivallales bacterium]
MSEKGDVHITFGNCCVLFVRYLLCLLFPPLAVLDKGCGTILLVLLFTLFGWLPGTILAFLICFKDKNYFRKG